MNKILVPVDFSKYSENALIVAADLAKKHNASLIILHMLGLTEAVLTKNEANEMESLFHIKLAERHFSELLEKEYLKGIKVERMLKKYTVFTELGGLAEQENIDLIVMGSHGTNGVSDIFVGSNTEKVVRTSLTPVLVIKDDKALKMTKGVFVSDFKEESLAAYNKAVNLFSILNIPFDLLYLNLPSNDFKTTDEIDQRIVNFGSLLDKDIKLLPENVIRYTDYSIELGVFNYAKKSKADIICIPTHGRRGLSHFFTGSISEDIVNHSKLPVLTIKI